MRYSILHPSRSRAAKSFSTLMKWMLSSVNDFELIISLDSDDPQKEVYKSLYRNANAIIIENPNTSSVEAINNAAKIATGDILMVVSDDTDAVDNWQESILKEVEGKKDWILKTQDGIQDYIITFPVLDKIYYNRTGYVYHPGYRHLFADTYLTCVADINGRKITSNLLFPHKHYSHSGGKEGPDELHKRNDATWSQGEELFIKLINQYSIEDRRKISDFGMKNWLRRKGVQI